MLGKTPNKVYDPFLKTGLGYKIPERLQKAIAAQPKRYDSEKLYNVNLKIDSPDSEETLEDAEESRLKIRNKMVQINYGKLNALYETFKNDLLKDELAKRASDSKDIQANLLKRIKILENDFKRSQSQKSCVLLKPLRFGSAFCLLRLASKLRFASAFCLVEDLLAFCQGETQPISIFGCVLSKDIIAFCLKTSLRFASRHHCVLLQDILRFTSLRFASRHPAFCLKKTAFCPLKTRPNGDALRKCILKGPYTPTIVTTPAIPATEDSPVVPEQTTVETVMNMTPENSAHFESEKEAIHLILTGIGDEIYSTVDAWYVFNYTHLLPLKTS
ncbi:hypothetical protein Tco_0420445 [Tanacetum coccineum]